MPAQGPGARLTLVPLPFRPSEAVTFAARRLRAVREALGVQQQDMARACGAEPNRWSNWESARTLPDPLVMARAQALFGISLDWIYAGDPSNLPFKVVDALRRDYPDLITARADDGSSPAPEPSETPPRQPTKRRA